MDFLTLLLKILEDPQVKVLVAAILILVVVRVLRAVAEGDFSFKEVPEFARKYLIPYVVGYALLRLLGIAFGISIEIPGVGTLEVLSSAFFLAALGALVARILENLKALDLKV